MKENYSQPLLLSRRSFIKSSGKVALSTAVVSSPVANAFLPAALPAGEIVVSLFLHAARFVAGLIFDETSVVIVKKVTERWGWDLPEEKGNIKGITSKKRIVKKVLEKGISDGMEKYVEYVVDYYQGLPDDKETLDRDLYREQVIKIHPVRLGMSDEEYSAYQEQSQRIILNRDEDLQRFEEITRYLVDTKTRILLPKHNISDEITSNLKPEELITGHLRFKNPNLREHYEKLLERTEVSVFKQLVT